MNEPSASLATPASIGALDAVTGLRAARLKADAQRSPEEAAGRFEALLGGMLVKEMRKALPDGFFGQGTGSDVYGGWLDEHLGKALAETGSLGLRDVLLPALGGAPAAAPDAPDAKGGEVAR